MVRVTESNLNATAETDAGYGQLFSVLMRRRFWLLGVLGGVLSLATLYTLIAQPTYKSTMQLLIEANYQGRRETDPQQLQSQQFADSSVKIDDYATQINVMRSSLLIQRAVDILRPEYPTIDVEEIKKIWY